jgi:chlorophyll synthase
MNDFKSVEGDSKFGLKSIPVMYGFNTAKYIVMLSQDLPQVVVAAYLYSIGESMYAYILLLLLVPQIYFQKSLLIDEDPLKNDIAYVTSTAPLISLAILLSAICVGNHVS